MMQYLNISILSVVSFFLLTGCADNPKANPQDTILGSNYRSSLDWIDDEDIYSEQGLSLREDSSLNGVDVNEYASKPAMASVYFGFDNASVTPKERAKLAEITTYLNKNPNTGLLVVGHCDWHGTQGYNLPLSDRRAKSVENYLEDLGIQSARIRTLAKGSLEAKYKGSPNECWQDRRSDLIVIQQ